MERKNNWKAWLYLAPALILMALFTFFPLINTFIVSFMSDYRSYSLGRGTGFTFKNYRLAGNDFFVFVLVRSDFKTVRTF